MPSSSPRALADVDGVPSYEALYALASRVRTSPEGSWSALRAYAASLLGEPTEPCPECGFPTLPDHPCPCLQYVGEPPNPAAAEYHRASKG